MNDRARSTRLTAATLAALCLCASASAGATPSGAPEPAPRKMTLAAWAGEWIGHGRTLKITRKGIATETIYSGCCDRVLDMRLRLSDPRGTAKRGTVKARVLSVDLHGADSWNDGPAPKVGQTVRLRLKREIVTEPLTGITYCSYAAQMESRCGA